MVRTRRNKRSRKSALPAHLKHEVAVTLTKYVPPMRPWPREAAFKVRRVLQRSFKCVQDSSVETQGLFSTNPADWFNSEFSSSGFEFIFVHRVAVWSEIVVPGTGQTVFPTLIVYFNDTNGTSLYPDFRGSAGAYNERARVGFYVPSHLSGPFSKNSTKELVNGKVFNSYNVGTFPVQSVLIELDITYCWIAHRVGFQYGFGGQSSCNSILCLRQLALRLVSSCFCLVHVLFCGGSNLAQWGVGLCRPRTVTPLNTRRKLCVHTWWIRCRGSTIGLDFSGILNVVVPLVFDSVHPPVKWVNVFKVL